MVFQHTRRWVLAAIAGSVTAPAVCPSNSACALPIDTDTVYVRAPRFGDAQDSLWPDTACPLTPDPGASLMLLLLSARPERAGLVDAPIGNGALAHPHISFSVNPPRIAFTSSGTDPDGEFSSAMNAVRRRIVATPRGRSTGLLHEARCGRCLTSVSKRT